MNSKVQEIIDTLTAHAVEIEDVPAKEVIRLYKYNIVPSKMGALWNTAFTCQVMGEGDLRQLNAYMLFSQIRMCENEMFTLEHMKAIFRDSVPLSANFLATCGFEQLWDDTLLILDNLDEFETKEDYRKMLDAYCRYVTNLHDWVHFFFPWYLGDGFKQLTEEDAKEIQALWDWTNERPEHY